MYKMQEKEMATFTGVRATMDDGTKIDAIKNKAEILELAKTQEGRKRLIAILQQWQNNTFDRLSTKGFDIGKALLFINMGVTYFGTGKSNSAVQRYLKNRKLFLEAVGSEEKRNKPKYKSAIEYMLNVVSKSNSGIKTVEDLFRAIENRSNESQSKVDFAKLLIARNPIDGFLGPMTLTAFVFLVSNKKVIVLNEPKPKPKKEEEEKVEYKLVADTYEHEIVNLRGATPHIDVRPLFSVKAYKGEKQTYQSPKLISIQEMFKSNNLSSKEYPSKSEGSILVTINYGGMFLAVDVSEDKKQVWYIVNPNKEDRENNPYVARLDFDDSKIDEAGFVNATIIKVGRNKDGEIVDLKSQPRTVKLRIIKDKSINKQFIKFSLNQNKVDELKDLFTWKKDNKEFEVPANVGLSSNALRQWRNSILFVPSVQITRTDEKKLVLKKPSETIEKAKILYLNDLDGLEGIVANYQTRINKSNANKDKINKETKKAIIEIGQIIASSRVPIKKSRVRRLLDNLGKIQNDRNANNENIQPEIRLTSTILSAVINTPNLPSREGNPNSQIPQIASTNTTASKDEERVSKLVDKIVINLSESHAEIQDTVEGFKALGSTTSAFYGVEGNRSEQRKLTVSMLSKDPAGLLGVLENNETFKTTAGDEYKNIINDLKNGDFRSAYEKISKLDKNGEMVDGVFGKNGTMTKSMTVVRIDDKSIILWSFGVGVELQFDKQTKKLYETLTTRTDRKAFIYGLLSVGINFRDAVLTYNSTRTKGNEVKHVKSSRRVNDGVVHNVGVSASGYMGNSKFIAKIGVRVNSDNQSFIFTPMLPRTSHKYVPLIPYVLRLSSVTVSHKRIGINRNVYTVVTKVGRKFNIYQHFVVGGSVSGEIGGGSAGLAYGVKGKAYFTVGYKNVDASLFTSVSKTNYAGLSTRVGVDLNWRINRFIGLNLIASVSKRLGRGSAEYEPPPTNLPYIVPSVSSNIIFHF